MLDHIERVGGVEVFLDGTVEHIVNHRGIRPAFVHGLDGVVDKDLVEVRHRHPLHFLLHDPCSKSIRASDFQDVIEAAEHFRDKLITGQKESEAAGIVLPDLAAHEPKSGETFPAALEKELILLFAGLRFFHGKAVSWNSTAFSSCLSQRLSSRTAGFEKTRR